tara:strand:+ start:22400 stop:22585 length:186 start_codon:yes stop_codon:yes gene_type:complete
MKSLLSKTFFLPLVIGSLAALGLTLALLGNGVFDVLSWLTLLPGLLAIILFRVSASTTKRR